MKVALYLRVSTETQDTDSQLSCLKTYAENRGMKIVDIYRDAGFSGARNNRPELDRLMADARKRKFNAVLVYKFDRFARSTVHLLQALEEFRSLGIDFVSCSEGIDTTISTGKMVFTMIGAIAEFERELIRDRVKAGIMKARERGKRLGRPRLDVDMEKMIKLRAEGKSVRQIAKALGIGKSTVGSMLGNAAQGVQNVSEN